MIEDAPEPPDDEIVDPKNDPVPEEHREPNEADGEPAAATEPA